ncbi:hypothetical protein AVEN_146652-1, partial [Araneus ventricosus]
MKSTMGLWSVPLIFIQYFKLEKKWSGSKQPGGKDSAERSGCWTRTRPE